MRLFTNLNKESRNVEDISPAELDLLLAKYFLSVREEVTGASSIENDRPEPGTLSAFQASIQRYLSSKNYANNILKDKEFQHSRNVLAAKKKELKKMGRGNKQHAAQAFTEAELSLFWENCELGTS
jgi:hypothetical protein